MTRVLTIASVLGGYGVLESFGLYWIVRDYMALPHPIVQALIFLKLLVSGHMTIYLTRNKGPIWERPLPSWKLVVPCEATQLLGTLAVVYGWFMAPTGWPLALLVWGYALVSFMVASLVRSAPTGFWSIALREIHAIWRASKAMSLHEPQMIRLGAARLKATRWIRSTLRNQIMLGIQLDLFGDYQSNVALYPEFQNFLRTHKPGAPAAASQEDYDK